MYLDSVSTITIWIFVWNTVGDTILMVVEPWFLAEAGKASLERENGGGFYYTIFGEDVVES